jgi:hypothetical protein
LGCPVLTVTEYFTSSWEGVDSGDGKVSALAVDDRTVAVGDVGGKFFCKSLRFIGEWPHRLYDDTHPPFANESG